MQPRTVKLGTMLTSLIERGGYSRNRQAILAAVGVSPAALSQYTRDETRPSFLRLVALADFFDVSLDYLVFGEPARRTVDHGPLARHVDRALAEAQMRANRHAALVTRIGRVLADRVGDIAREIAGSPPAGPEGLVRDGETFLLQRYGQQVCFLTMDLLGDLTGPSDDPACPPLVHAVAANLPRGCEYRFLLANGDPQAVAVSSLRSLLSSQAGADRVRRSCQFRGATTPVMFGAGFCRIDVAALASQDPVLHAQVSSALDADGWLGYLMRTDPASRGDILIGRQRLKPARDTFDALWAAGTRL